jgi:hypothetical protein
MSALPKIKGFDRQGEPELRGGENGGLELVFNFMPPTTAAGEERSPDLFENFEKVLSAHIGVAVACDDRETFIIAAPKDGTAEKLATYLSSFWKEHAKPLKAALAAVPRDPKAPFKNEKELYAALQDRLVPLVQPLGFKPAKFLDVSFRRKTDFGHDMVAISVLHGTYYKMSACLFVTHDIIEKIYAMASDMERRFLKGQWTKHGTLEGLAESACGDQLRRPADVDAWAAGFAGYFQTAGLAQLAELGDLEKLERQRNDLSVTKPDYLGLGMPDKLAATGLIIAKLLGRDHLEDIAAFHRNHLATQEGVNVFPQAEAVIMSLSRDELIARGNAYAKQKD